MIAIPTVPVLYESIGNQVSVYPSRIVRGRPPNVACDLGRRDGCKHDRTRSQPIQPTQNLRTTAVLAGSPAGGEGRSGIFTSVDAFLANPA